MNEDDKGNEVRIVSSEWLKKTNQNGLGSYWGKSLLDRNRLSPKEIFDLNLEREKEARKKKKK